MATKEKSSVVAVFETDRETFFAADWLDDDAYVMVGVGTPNTDEAFSIALTFRPSQPVALWLDRYCARRSRRRR